MDGDGSCASALTTTNWVSARSWWSVATTFTDEHYQSGICDEVIEPRLVIIKEEVEGVEVEMNVVLGFDGCTAPTVRARYRTGRRAGHEGRGPQEAGSATRVMGAR